MPSLLVLLLYREPQPVSGWRSEAELDPHWSLPGALSGNTERICSFLLREAGAGRGRAGWARVGAGIHREVTPTAPLWAGRGRQPGRGRSGGDNNLRPATGAGRAARCGIGWSSGSRVGVARPGGEQLFGLLSSPTWGGNARSGGRDQRDRRGSLHRRAGSVPTFSSLSRAAASSASLAVSLPCLPGLQASTRPSESSLIESESSPNPPSDPPDKGGRGALGMSFGHVSDALGETSGHVSDMRTEAGG